jgi:hypothetical protein
MEGNASTIYQIQTIEKTNNSNFGWYLLGLAIIIIIML